MKRSSCADDEGKESKKLAGINEVNQSTAKYEMVDKKQTYNFSEDGAAEEEFDHDCQIDVCDMRSSTFAADLGKALQDIGFALLVGHGIDKELLEQVLLNVRQAIPIVVFYEVY